MLSPETVVRFALTLIRFTTFLVVTPIFSLRSVPAVTTIGLASAAAILIMPPLEMSGVSQSFPVLALLVLHEVAVGLIPRLPSDLGLQHCPVRGPVNGRANWLWDGYRIGSEHRDADAGVFSVLFLGHRVGVFRP